MNINHVLQTCTMITGGDGIPTLVTHVYAVCTRRFFLHFAPPLSSAMGTRLGGTYQAEHTFHYKNFKFVSVHNKSLIDFNNYRQFTCCVVVIHMR